MATRSGHKAGARVDDVALFQPSIGYGLTHGDMGIGRARPHEPQRALVHMLGRVDIDCACNLAAKTVFGQFSAGFDAGQARLERGKEVISSKRCDRSTYPSRGDRIAL